MDTSPAAVTQVNADGHATARLADVADLPYPDGAFDVTTARHMLYHVAEPLSAVRELARVTRPGGLVVATVNHRDGLPRVVGLVTEELARAGVQIRFSAGSSDSDLLPEQLEQGGLTNVVARRCDNALVFPSPEPLARFAVAILGVYGLVPGHPSHPTVVEAIRGRVTDWFASEGGPWIDPKGYTVGWGTASG